MRPCTAALLSALALSHLALSACTTTDDDDADVDFIAGRYACEDAGLGPEWTFGVDISGPASDDGSRAYIALDGDAEIVPLLLVGSNGDVSRSFEATIPGTVAGEQPAAGDLPFDCDQEADVLVRLCARDFGAAAELCYACDDGSDGTVPDGAVRWVDCG